MAATRGPGPRSARRHLGDCFLSFRWSRRRWARAWPFPLLAVIAVVLGGVGADGDVAPEEVKAEKHYTELDLTCQSYKGSVDWTSVKQHVKTWLRDPGSERPFLEDLVRIGREQRTSDCYIGLCSVGYLALLFMDPQRRANAMEQTLFGSVSLHEQIPLSYWDTIASGWPVFGLLELVASELRHDGLTAPPTNVDGCCDYLDSPFEQTFKDLVEDRLGRGLVVPTAAALKYLAESPARCSWGKATAYFALAEHVLWGGSSNAEKAAKDLMVLGELQLDRCAKGRNVTVSEHMHSRWPFWSILRRVESEATVSTFSQHVRLPSGYQAPPLAPFAARPPGLGARGGEPRAREQDVCSGRDVHVAFSGDKRHAEGVLAAVNSVIYSTPTPERLCLHVFCLTSEVDFFRHAFTCSFGAAISPVEGSATTQFTLHKAAVRVHSFERSEVLTSYLLVDDGIALETGNLNAPHNYIRFHLTRWISPEVAPRVVYLDTDVIVVGDVCELHDGAFGGGRGAGEVVAAVPRFHLPLAVYLKALSPRMPLWLPSTAPSFNAGVMVIDVRAWEESNITSAVDTWARRNRGRELWRHGSQPPLLLLLHDRVRWLDEVWNVDGLGHYKNHTPGALAKAKILHWTGPLKPWASNGLHKDLWEPFAVHCWKGWENSIPQ